MKNANSNHLDQCIGRLYKEFDVATVRGILKVIYEEMGGMRVTIPTIKELEIAERDSRIRIAFNGGNHEELAIRFGLSVRQIRRIVNNPN